MTKDMIIQELKSRGYNAEAQNFIKNGIEIEGIRIFSEAPVIQIIYSEKLIEKAEKEKKNLDDVVSMIVIFIKVTSRLM